MPKYELQPSTNGDLMTRMMLLRDDLAAFTDVSLRCAVDDNGIELCESELYLLMSTVLTYLNAKKEIPHVGSLTLYSQQLAESGWDKQSCLLCANLRDGYGHIPQRELFVAKTTLEVVHSAAEEVFQYSKVEKGVSHKVSCLLPQRGLDAVNDDLESGIYQDTFQSVLVFNSDLGRYVASYCDNSMSNGHEVLPVIAQTLACLRRDDVIAQESAMLVQNGLLEGEWLCRGVMDAIEWMFGEQTDPLLTEWRNWSYDMEA